MLLPPGRYTWLPWAAGGMAWCSCIINVWQMTVGLQYCQLADCKWQAGQSSSCREWQVIGRRRIQRDAQQITVSRPHQLLNRCLLGACAYACSLWHWHTDDSDDATQVLATSNLVKVGCCTMPRRAAWYT